MKKKRQLIEMTQEYLIQCDNDNCDYTIPNPTKDPFEDTKQYINMPCPKCGENLLTQKDYDDSMTFLKKIMWINKYFSWLTYFSSKRENPIMVETHVHDNKITITKE